MSLALLACWGLWPASTSLGEGVVPGERLHGVDPPSGESIASLSDEVGTAGETAPLIGFFPPDSAPKAVQSIEALQSLEQLQSTEPIESRQPPSEMDPRIGVPLGPLRTVASGTGRVPSSYHPSLTKFGASSGNGTPYGNRPSTQGATGLSKAAVGRMVSAQVGHVAQCRARADFAAPPLRVVVAFEIGVDGSVGNLEVLPDGEAPSATLQCIAQAFSRLHFRPLDRGPLHIRYPVVLG